MSFQVRFTPLADRDVAEAYAWYEASRSNLGEEFLYDLNGVLDVIARFPEGWPEVHRGLHRAVLHRFPYSLYYRHLQAPESIEVRACIHQLRHPRSWRGRL